MKPCAANICLLVALAMLTFGGHETSAGAENSPVAAAKQAPKEVPLSGKILETMDGGGYTYVLLNNGGDKVWVAIPLRKVSVGQELTLIPGYEMKDFNSKGLHRKFDRLIFSAGLTDQKLTLSPSALKMAHAGVPAPKATPAPKAATAAPKAAARKGGKGNRVDIRQVAKAKGPNAYTIAQLYAKKTRLEKKPIVVRGRVVTVSPRILKRNWIHIQDGSGSAGRKNNDLTITSQELPKVGDLVTVSGTLYNNIDFGSGYRYSLIVEGARFK